MLFDIWKKNCPWWEHGLVPKAKISSTTHVQLLQWLHGKQQQHVGDYKIISMADQFCETDPNYSEKFCASTNLQYKSIMANSIQEMGMITKTAI